MTQLHRPNGSLPVTDPAAAATGNQATPPPPSSSSAAAAANGGGATGSGGQLTHPHSVKGDGVIAISLTPGPIICDRTILDRISTFHFLT